MTTHLNTQIVTLKNLLKNLQAAPSLKDKIFLLNHFPPVQTYKESASFLSDFLAGYNLEEEFAFKSILAINQGLLVFGELNKTERYLKDFKSLLSTLVDLEKAYETIGGIIGYHLTVLQLLIPKKEDLSANLINYLQPQGLDLVKDKKAANRAVREGIEHLQVVAEIYPVGGAGDRFNLRDEQTKISLPVAQLKFEGRSLLEGLIRDLQGREYLYFKLMGTQLITPIAMMTSEEKDNDRCIQKLCADNKWFGRCKENFKFFIQPLVPVITKEGDWATIKPLHLILKPGGHGVIWKLAYERGIAHFFKQQKRSKLLIRQINNPVAGVDQGLLALAGVGCQKNKLFGFASCPRLLGTAEGVNVLIEKQLKEGYSYCLTNIEYTDFEHKGIDDHPANKGEAYSIFPSNTNILFADLDKLMELAKDKFLPGILINMKTKVHCLDRQGQLREIEAGRLESTMQNIADHLTNFSEKKLEKEKIDQLHSFITFNERTKTISVTKTSYLPGKDLIGTPEGCFYEMTSNHISLLKQCGIKTPAINSKEAYLKEGPTLIFRYHPALGPLYAIISQKISKGRVEKGAELELEIAELEIKDISIKGSLRIFADQVLGKYNEEGQITYSSLNGKCRLKNVVVNNRGINYQVSNSYWENRVERHEELKIVLKGCAEFVAEDVYFEGSQLIEVPDGHRLTAFNDENKKVSYQLEKLENSNSLWNYRFTKTNQIKLKINK